MDKKRILKDFQKAKNKYKNLKNTQIKITFKDDSSKIMMSRPKFNFLLKTRKNRKYKIIINTKKYKKFVLKLTDKEIEAWLAHELGHINQYLKLSNFQIIKFACKYFLFPKFKRKIENQADSYAIKKGLGKPLLQGVLKTLNSKDVEKGYKECLIKYYTSVKDLKKKIKKQKSK